jgi:hypothetical protein
MVPLLLLGDGRHWKICCWAHSGQTSSLWDVEDAPGHGSEQNETESWLKSKWKKESRRYGSVEASAVCSTDSGEQALSKTGFPINTENFDLWSRGERRSIGVAVMMCYSRNLETGWWYTLPTGQFESGLGPIFFFKWARIQQIYDRVLLLLIGRERCLFLYSENPVIVYHPEIQKMTDLLPDCNWYGLVRCICESSYQLVAIIDSTDWITLSLKEQQMYQYLWNPCHR